jgi:polyisoprenoid-binding protein YceI
MAILDISVRTASLDVLRVARLAVAVFGGLVLLQAAPAAGQQSAVEFTVSGTSTIRGWTCTVSGTAAVTRGSSDPAPGFDTGVQTATLTVPVKAFECPNEEMMEHLFDAMKPDQHPEITFQLDGYEASRQGAETSGALTILGVTHAMTFPISLSPSGGGVEIEGDIRLDMTTFGVEPPVVMLGLLRVRPEIRIEFTGVVVP